MWQVFRGEVFISAKEFFGFGQEEKEERESFENFFRLLFFAKFTSKARPLVLLRSFRKFPYRGGKKATQNFRDRFFLQQTAGSRKGRRFSIKIIRSLFPSSHCSQFSGARKKRSRRCSHSVRDRTDASAKIVRISTQREGEKETKYLLLIEEGTFSLFDGKKDHPKMHF